MITSRIFVPDESKNASYTHLGVGPFNLVCGILYGTTLYVHIHEVNGVVIVHSHPFTEHHSHSGGQALTLHYLSTFTSLDWHTAESVCPDFPLLYLLTFNFNAFHTLALYGEGIYLRAPPINLFI